MTAPLVLAVDTTGEHGSVALGDEEIPLHAPTGFAHVIYPALGMLLDQSGARLVDVDCFAAASGPGSFTGLRVGLACIKGLAEAMGKPAVAVSKLEALARFGSGPLRAVIEDARRGEVYGAVYDAAGQAVVPETVGPLADWLGTLPSGELEFIAQDFAVVGDRLPAGPRTRAPGALARTVAGIARERFRRGAAEDPAALDANYVRRADAERFSKP